MMFTELITETINDRMAKSIRYITPVPHAAATGLLAETYQQMQTDFLAIPLLTLHSPMPELMAGVWSLLRESLLAGHVDRAHKEVVAATVSKSNQCPFCVDAHSLMLEAASEHDAAGAILRGDYRSIRAPELRALTRWALAHRTAEVPDDQPPPFSAHEAPEIVGTALAFDYINRMVNVFLGDTLLPVPSAMKGLAGRLLGATAGRQMVRRLAPGRSLALIPRADLPEDLAWAAASPAVAGALAGLAHVIEQAGAALVPEPVRRLAGARIAEWRGQNMSLSRRWAEDAIAGAEPAHQPAARLALLAALASYQIDADVIAEFRARYPADAQLIAVTAWASFAAARRTSTWLAEPFMIVGRAS